MIPSPDPTPARPSLALRIGITGSRKLRADQLARIHGEIQDALASSKQQMERLSHEPMVLPFYEHEADGRANATLHMISPLARGADRLAARTAVELGYKLFVPMPFAKTEYEKDFTGCNETHSEEAPLTAAEDLAEFRDLLACASAHLALDGARDTEATTAGDDTLVGRSYEFVGRFVVRHSDLLIAVWDGKASNGRGGTADIIRYAANAGVPVWWIHATENTPPVWIADIQDLRDPEPNSASPGDKLAKHLANLIPAPRRVDRHDHGWIGYLGSLFRKKDTSPGPAYFTERARPGGGIRKTHAKVMALASRVNTPWTPPRCPEEPVSRYWFDRYEPADARSGEYAARYRSGYVWVIVLTTLALVFGALALGFSLSAGSGKESLMAIAGLVMAILELLALIAAVMLVSASLGAEWHERSIEYRLLAELFRKQQTLAPLGWALSIGTVRPLAETEQLSWVVWLFAATQRAAPLPNGDAAGAVQGESGRAVLQDLIEEQLTYHHGRERMAHNASATFERLGGWAFSGVLICVVLKIAAEILAEGWHWNHDSVVVFGVLAIMLFGISAGSVALRSYAELQMLAEQSRHMIAELEHAKARVERLNLQRPLVSQDLGAIAASVAATMLQDLEGWGRLFRGKQMEAS
jgi:hypothetical protein